MGELNNGNGLIGEYTSSGVPINPSLITGITQFHAMALVANVVPRPTINSITASGDNIVLTGTSNTGTNGTYHIYTSTDVTQPVTNWNVLASGTFDSNGNFSYTNAVGSSVQQFFLLKVP